MAQVFLHSLDVVPCSKGIDRVGVTQVVDADVWHTEALHDPLEAIIKVRLSRKKVFQTVDEKKFFMI